MNDTDRAVVKITDHIIILLLLSRIAYVIFYFSILDPHFGMLVTTIYIYY